LTKRKGNLFVGELASLHGKLLVLVIGGVAKNLYF
jgi:hypothetical protein